MIQTAKILKHLERTTDEVFSSDELRDRLLSGRPLKIKYGVDVTAPFLHLGHAVNLWMMRYLQEYGHKVQFLLGDFTTTIGDPTGRNETRPQLSTGEIEANAQHFIRQVGRVLITDDPRVFEVRRNSEWFSKMPTSEFLSLLSTVTHAKLVSRDMFQKRIADKHDIYMHELLYPILQGYDSAMLQSDLTIVGSDQLFNEMMGRFFQERMGQSPQVVLTTKITAGLDGKAKQSKSLNNYIAIADAPREMLGKAMSMPDPQIYDWLRVYTEVPLDQIAKLEEETADGANPRDAKLFLAHEIVRRYHGQACADAEKLWFERSFSQDIFPDDAPMITVSKSSMNALDLLKECLPTESNAALRRLLEQSAVQWDGLKLDLSALVVCTGPEPHRLKVGKKRFFKIQA